MWAVAAQPRTGLTPMIPTPSADSGILVGDQGAISVAGDLARRLVRTIVSRCPILARLFTSANGVPTDDLPRGGVDAVAVLGGVSPAAIDPVLGDCVRLAAIRPLLRHLFVCHVLLRSCGRARTVIRLPRRRCTPRWRRPPPRSVLRTGAGRRTSRCAGRRPLRPPSPGRTRLPRSAAQPRRQP